MIFIKSDDDGYGFKKIWYLVTDDSKHWKVDRHVCLITDCRSSTEHGHPSPNFRFLTGGVAATKTSEGNSDLNVQVFLNMLPYNALSHFGGGTTDNASDAKKETRLTFQKIQKHLVENSDSDQEIEDITRLYGVERWAMNMGDGFHKDNLAVHHASVVAFGDTDRSNHSEVHHRQLIQSLHDVNSNDLVISQATF